MKLDDWQRQKGVKIMRRWLIALSLLALGIYGCGGGKAPAPQVGTIIVTFLFPTERLIPSATEKITVTVGGEGLLTPLKGEATRAQPKVVFSDVPPGAKFLLAWSLNDSSVMTVASSTTSVTAGATSRVEMDLQPFSPPDTFVVESGPNGLFSLTRQSIGQSIFLGNSGGIQWGGFADPKNTVIFDQPLLLPDDAKVGQSVSQDVQIGEQTGIATMRLVGFTGVSLPSGDFNDCAVLEFSVEIEVVRLRLFTATLYLAEGVGTVMIFEGSPLGFSGQPSGNVLPLVLVSRKVSGTVPTGALSKYLPLQTDNRYDFSQLLSPEEPPNQPFP